MGSPFRAGEGGEHTIYQTVVPPGLAAYLIPHTLLYNASVFRFSFGRYKHQFAVALLCKENHSA